MFLMRITGPKIPLLTEKEIITIGRRGPIPVDLSLEESDCISRKHLEIRRIDKDLYFKCFSKNGIFVNGYFYLNENESIKLPDG